MKSWTIAAALVVLGLVVASGYILFAPPSGTKGSSSGTTGTGGAPIIVTADSLTVGYQSGLWTLTLKNVGAQPLVKVTGVLFTPVESKLCTGVAYSSLSFFNCPATGGRPIEAGSTIGGYATGAGPGSAVVGTSYNVTITSTFQDGTVYVTNTQVVASSA